MRDYVQWAAKQYVSPQDQPNAPERGMLEKLAGDLTRGFAQAALMSTQIGASAARPFVPTGEENPFSLAAENFQREIAEAPALQPPGPDAPLLERMVRGAAGGVGPLLAASALPGGPALKTALSLGYFTVPAIEESLQRAQQIGLPQEQQVPYAAASGAATGLPMGAVPPIVEAIMKSGKPGLAGALLGLLKSAVSLEGMSQASAQAQRKVEQAFGQPTAGASETAAETFAQGGIILGGGLGAMHAAGRPKAKPKAEPLSGAAGVPPKAPIPPEPVAPEPIKVKLNLYLNQKESLLNSQMGLGLND